LQPNDFIAAGEESNNRYSGELGSDTDFVCVSDFAYCWLVMGVGAGVAILSAMLYCITGNTK
jgi:hypothetical protein